MAPPQTIKEECTTLAGDLAGSSIFPELATVADVRAKMAKELNMEKRELQLALPNKRFLDASDEHEIESHVLYACTVAGCSVAGYIVGSWAMAG